MGHVTIFLENISHRCEIEFYYYNDYYYYLTLEFLLKSFLHVSDSNEVFISAWMLSNAFPPFLGTSIPENFLLCIAEKLFSQHFAFFYNMFLYLKIY